METKAQTVQRARELCEQQIEYWSLPKMRDSYAPIFEKIQLNSWTTHLKELDEHKANDGKCSRCYTDCHDYTGLGCDVPSTCNQYFDYPCDFAYNKSLRLLGEDE